MKGKCGICGSTENIAGPSIGGPFAWYCESCKKIIDKFMDGVERHKKLFLTIVRQRREGPLELQVKCPECKQNVLINGEEIEDHSGISLSAMAYNICMETTNHGRA